MDATGSGWQSWAQEYLEQGTIADRLIENMEPNTEYLVYAYGVDPITIERLTPISKKTLTTLAPQTIDTKFDIQIVSTEGLNIDVLVKANDYDGHLRMRPFWRKYRKVGSTTYRSTDGWATRPK